MAEDRTEVKIVSPQRGFQERFVSSNVDVCFGGGILNCGKTFASVLSTSEPSLDPEFRAVFIRKTFTEITSGGGMYDEFRTIYGSRAQYKQTQPPRVTFPSGAYVDFRQVNNEDIKKIQEEWKGAQYTLIYIDEATSIAFSTFKYLMTRNRSKSRFHPTIKATMNPERECWIRPFIDWYVGSDGRIIPERDGVIRYFYIYGDSPDDVIWGDTKAEVWAKGRNYIEPKLRALGGDFTYENMIKSFVFYLGKMSENKASIGSNMDYAGSVASVGGHQAEQFILGDWNASSLDDGAIPISPAKAQAVASVDSQAGPSRYIVADLADTGKDNCFIIAMHGMEVVDVDIIPKSTPRQNCERVRRMARKHNVGDSHILYDAQRAAYVLDYIPDAQGVYSFAKPRGMYRKDFVRLKDEYYFRLVESVNNYRFSIAPDVWNAPYIHNKVKGLTIGQEFCDECAVIRFKEDSWGRKQLAQKTDMNAMLGKDRSMDVLDCIAMGMIPYLQYEYGSELTKVKDEYSIIPEEDDYGKVDIYAESTWC